MIMNSCLEFEGSFKQMGKAYRKASKEVGKVNFLMEHCLGYAEFSWNDNGHTEKGLYLKYIFIYR